MHTIRPYKLFTLVAADRIAQVPIPRRRAKGGLTLLETCLLVSTAKIVTVRRSFEFGTFLGSTTYSLALNTPEEAVIFTLDLDEKSATRAKQSAEDISLTQIHLASESTLDFHESPMAKKIRILTGDSTTFDFSPWKGAIDLIFIDGGHDLDTVRSDTENAFKMVARDKSSCILWHDYGNAAWSPLTGFLDDLSRSEEIFYFGDTMLCAWFNDPDRSIQSHLLSPDEEMIS